MFRRHRTVHRVTKSLSVKRKSPTSAWRRSTSSTRRTRDRCRAWYTKPAAAAAAAAEAAAVAAEAALAVAAEAALALAAEAAEAALAAGVVEAAEAAEAAAGLAGELAWELAAEAAARRGEVAAGARPDRFPTYIDKRGSSWPGSTRSARPIHICSAARACAWPSPRLTADRSPAVSRNASTRGNPVIGEYALQQRTRALGQQRVLRS